MKCINCNNETPLWGKKSKKYCNINCQRQYEKENHKKKYNVIKCIICDNDFIPKTFKSICCSKVCKQKYDAKKISKKPKIKVCKNCNKEYNPYTSITKFCSANCRVENIKKKRKFNWNNDSVEKRKGIKNPAYVNGDRLQNKKIDSTGLRLFEKNRKEYINEMINEFGYTYCQKCKETNKKLEAHHIIYRSEKPKHQNLHDKINIILVCVKCHNWFHKKKGNRNDIVNERNLHLIFGNDVLDK